MQELQKDLAAKGVVWLLVNSVNQKISAIARPNRRRRKWPLKKWT